MNINPETGLYEEYSFMYEPFFLKLSFIIPAITITTLILMLLFYFTYKYYQKRKIARLSAADRAFYMLEQLKKTYSKKEGKDIKFFATNLLIIMQDYGEKKFNEKISSSSPQECAMFFCDTLKEQEQKKVAAALFSEIELILFSSNYQKENDFFIKAPKEIYLLINECEKKH